MRIREMAYYINQVNFEECRLSYTSATIGNIQSFKEAIPFLQNIPIFQKEIQDILAAELYSTSHDSLTFGTTTRAYNVYADAMKIINKASLLLDLSNEIYPPLSENTISIKLPETSDMRALYHYIKSFEQAFSILLTDDAINSTISIENWEHGSFWINLYAGSALAIGVISGTVWASAVIANKYQEVKIHEQYVRSLNIKNESLEDLLQAQKELTDDLINMETRAIIDKHLGGSTDQEKFERVKLAIKTIAELINQGAEINPALDAPENVQNLFPDFSRLDSIQSRIPQIVHKKNED